MKKFLLILKGFTMMLILILTASAVNAATRTATASGPWNNNATWGNNPFPVLGDDVVIGNFTITVGAAAQCNSITFTTTTGIINVNSGITLNVTTSIILQNSATINTAAVLGGAGTINCASVSVGGTVSPSTNSTLTTILTSTISSLSLTGNLVLNGQHSTGNRRNAPTFNLGSGNVSIGGTAVLTADDAGSGATLTLASAPQTGTLTLSGTTPLTIDANSAFIANGTSATVNYSGGTQTVGTVTYTNLALTGSGAKTVTGATVNGTLSLQGTATATGTSPTYGPSAILEYKGSAAQTISNVEFPGTGANPTNLTIDNTNGVTLGSAKTINGALTLVNGYLTTVDSLIIGTGGSASTSNGAFVNGKLTKIKNNTSSFLFPVGTIAGGLRTIRIIPASSTATTFTAQFFKGNPLTAFPGPYQSPIVGVSGCEYWILNRVAGTANAAVTLSWASNSCGSATYVTNPATLLVARYNGTTWVSEGNGGASAPADTVKSFNNVSSFSPFAIGTTNSVENPLPVVFANVKAYEKNGGVQIEWSNMTESDVASYTVERSTNGQNFTAINQHSPKGNQLREENYTSFDGSPFTGINLYRIKALENSGKIVYSKILRVDINNLFQTLTLYPNPVKDNLLSVGINAKQGQYNLRVLNNAGQQVFSKVLIHQGGNLTQTIELPSSVKAGVYNMVVSGDNFRQTKMFIIQ